jgi:DNA-directed RNA polymerase subunit RPC12/RpoP
LSKDVFKCLHCGNTYELEQDAKQEMKDRVCPKCKSNSVRKIKPQ